MINAISLLWILAAAVIASAYRHEIVVLLSAIASFFGVGSVSLANTPQPRRTEADDVLAGAFAPRTCAPGALFLVQVVLCRTSDAAKAARQAAHADPEARQRGKMVLNAEIALGDEVVVELRAEGQKIDEPRQLVVWRGQPIVCQFFVKIHRGTSPGPIGCHVRLVRNSIPVGSLRFVTRCEQSGSDRSEPVGDYARRYHHAFLSYASADRAEVLKRAQALRAAQIAFFQDFLSLDPGERWKRRLYEEIDRCDLFLLFWSSSARRSEWVRREVERALARQRGDGRGLPDITPVILEGPPPPAPPEAWSDIHFDDQISYLVAATEALRSGKSSASSQK